MDRKRRELLKQLAWGALATTLPARAWGAEAAPAEQEKNATLAPLPRRGIHVLTGGAANRPALTKLVGEIAPALGLNYVILEIDGNFKYASHPECAEPDPLTKDDAKQLVTLAKDKGITLVPMYQCLGHQSWHAQVGALLRGHPEFNEALELDPSAEDFYCMTWCPSNPKVTDVVFDLMDELSEAFQAKHFHVGMDEVFIFGYCPLCKGKSNATLFQKAVLDIHGHLVGKRKLEMMMWGDRLLDGSKMKYRGWDESNNDTWQAVETAPKDIVMCDWHYSLEDHDFASVRYFQEKGFRVWPSGWNEEEAIRRFVEVAREEKTLGYMCTTWVDVTKLVNGLAGDPVDDREIAGVVAGVKLGAKLAQGKSA